MKYSQKKTLFLLYSVNFFWSMATLMIITTLTIYYETVLHITKLQIGSIQAFAALSMYITKLLSGIIIDIFKNYKFIILIGSTLSMILRPLFAFAQTPASILSLRALDRLSKGIRSTPMDTFITITQDPNKTGKSIAYKQVAYTAGGILGCICAFFILSLTNVNFTILYKSTIIPGAIATLILLLIKTPTVKHKLKKETFKWKEIKTLSPIIIEIYFLAYAITCARPGESFIGHRFYEFGIPVVYLPLIYILHDCPFLLTSIYASKIFDTMNWKKVLLYALGCLSLSNLCFLMSNSLYGLILGAAFGGIQLAIKQGLFLTLLAKYTPTHIRGTTFAIYQIVVGLGLFSSYLLTGYFANYFQTWKAGFISQTIIALLLVLIISIHLKSIRFVTNKTSY